MLTVVKLAWYLCAVLLMGTLGISVITVVPELEAERDVAAGLTVFASLMFGGLAAYLTKRYAKPEQPAAEVAIAYNAKPRSRGNLFRFVRDRINTPNGGVGGRLQPDCNSLVVGIKKPGFSEKPGF